MRFSLRAYVRSRLFPDRNTRYDRQTVDVMKRVLRPDSTAIDVGAHAGAILRSMVRFAPRGRHYAFEPLPGMCEELRARFPNVEVHNLALSDVAGTATFQWVVSNPGYSGLRRRRYSRPTEQIQEIEVRVARLDDVVPQDLQPAFIKIDVEGAELQVLRGAVRTLERTQPVVVFEHGSGAADFYGTDPGDVFDLLLGCGLAVSRMEDWLAGRPPLGRARFRELFQTGAEYYFMAARSGTPPVR